MIRPKVTIIVPVYNVEKYLTCCIGSILSQSFKDFELLLIDDGSSDLSGEICDDYVEKDARIRVFHKENGGVSSARNLGLDNAQGEWICFIDSDDWVEVDFLKELIQYDSFDLVVGGCEGVGCMIYSTKRNENLIIDFKQPNKAAQILNANNENTISAFYYSCGKLFRNSIISQYDLRFDIRMKMCEDTCFLIQYLIHVNEIILSNFSLYRYRLSSIPSKYASDYNCCKTHIDLFDGYLSELEYILNDKMIILKRKIYTAILTQYLIHLKAIENYSVFKQEVCAFNDDFTYMFWKEMNFGRIKSWIYCLIFRFPLLEYNLMRILLSYKR